MGNLTILSQPLNSEGSHSAWNIKKPLILGNSLLPINQKLLYNAEVWDEDAIADRSNKLLERALKIWPRSL
jgi:hypothetical protein